MLKDQPQSTIPNNQGPITNTVFGNDVSHLDDDNLQLDATHSQKVIEHTLLRYNFRLYILSQVSAPIKELCNNYPDIVLFDELKTLITECKTFKRNDPNNAKEDDPLKNNFSTAVSIANTLIHCFEICKELAPQLIEDGELLNELNIFSKTYELLINKPRSFKALFKSTTKINELHQFLMPWAPDSTPSVSVMSYSQWKSETGVPAKTSNLKSAENTFYCYEYRQYLHTQLHDKLTILIKEYPAADHFLTYANKKLEFQFKIQDDSPKTIKLLLASNKEQQLIITLLKSLEKCALKLTKEKNNYASIDNELRTYLNENILQSKGKKCTFLQLITRKLKAIDNFYILPSISKIDNAQRTLSIEDDVLTFTKWKEKYDDSSLIDSTGTNILAPTPIKAITTNTDTNMPNMNISFNDMISDSVFQAEDYIFSSEIDVLNESDDNQTPNTGQIPPEDRYTPSFLRFNFRLYIYEKINNSIETLYSKYPKIDFFKKLKDTFVYKLAKSKDPENAESARAKIGFNNMTSNANKLVHCLEMCELLAPQLSEGNKYLTRINEFSQNCKLITKKPVKFSRLITSTKNIEQLHDFIKEIAPNCTPGNPVKSYNEWKLNTLANETTLNQNKIENVTMLYSYNFRKFLYDKLHRELEKLIQYYPNAYHFLIETQNKLSFVLSRQTKLTLNQNTLIYEAQNRSISLLLTGLENCAKAFTAENETNDRLHEKFIQMLNNLIFRDTRRKYAFSTFISKQLAKFCDFVIQSSSTINITTSILATDNIYSFSKWKELIADNKSIENDPFRQSKTNVASSMTVTSNANTNNHYSNISQDPLAGNSNEELLRDVFDESVFDIDILHLENNFLPNPALDTTNEQEYVYEKNEPTFLRYETPATLTHNRFNYRSDLYIKLHNNLTTLIKKYAYANEFLEQVRSLFSFKILRLVNESNVHSRTYSTAIPKETIVLLLEFLEKCALSFTEIEEDNKSLGTKFHEFIKDLIADSRANRKRSFTTFITTRHQKLVELNNHPVFSTIGDIASVLTTNNIYTFKEWMSANEQAGSELSHQAPISCNLDISKATTVTMTTTTNSNSSPISAIPEVEPEPEVVFSNTPQTSTDGLTKLAHVDSPSIYTPLRNTRSSTKHILKVRSSMNTNAMNSDNGSNKKCGIGP